MSQIISSHSKLLDESGRLIDTLQAYATTSSVAREALMRHEMLHQRLQEQQHRSEVALAEWRTALTRRWKCEIEGQRIYNGTVQHLRECYGDNTPQVQAIVPASSHAGTAADLLNDMRRLHAALVMMDGAYINAAHLDRLEATCAELNEALNDTERLEKNRRSATIERRMAEDACQRAMNDTTRLLRETLGNTMTIQPAAHAEVGSAFVYVE
jgi:hypothetical protein